MCHLCIPFGYDADWNSDKHSWDYKKRIKLSDNSTCELIISVGDDYDTFDFYPSLEVYRKRKHSDVFSRKSTGRVGLEPATFALRELSALEANLEACNRHNAIFVWGSDERRFKLYQKVLARRGYQSTNAYGSKAMFKKF